MKKNIQKLKYFMKTRRIEVINGIIEAKLLN